MRAPMSCCSAASSLELEKILLFAVEEIFVDWDSEVVNVDLLGGLDVVELGMYLSLVLSAHGELVEDILWSLWYSEDGNFVDDLGGSWHVEVLVVEGLEDGEHLAVPKEVDLSSLVVEVSVALTIVEVEGTGGEWLLLGVLGVTWVDLKEDWVLNCGEERHSVLTEVQGWDDGSTSDEGSLLLVGDMDDLWKVRLWHNLLGVELVPFLSWWKVDLDLGDATEEGHRWVLISHLWSNKNLGSIHELAIELEGHLVLWEFHPHWAHEWETVGVGLEEQVVGVVDHGVSVSDSFTDHVLDAWGLEPWLSDVAGHVSVSTEEWHELSVLVGLDVKVILWDSHEVWNIGSREWNTRNTEREELVEGHWNVRVEVLAVTSPHGTITLGTEEEGSGKDEWSLLASVSLEESLVGGSLLEGTVGVVDPSVLDDGAVLHDVSVGHWHANLVLGFAGLEDRWLVHVVPDTVHVVGSLEDGWVKEGLVELLSLLVEEINPDGFSWPGLAIEWVLGSWVSDEDVLDVAIESLLALELHTILEDMEFFISVDVWVDDGDEASLRVMDGVVHLHNIVLVEALVVELSVREIVGVLNVEPEDIDWETVAGEVVVSLDDILGGELLVLRVVISEGVDWWHWGVTSELRELLLEVLWRTLSSEEIEFKSVALRDESVVGSLAKVGVVDEDEGLSRVHPSDGRVDVSRVTHDVWDGSIKWGSLSEGVWELVLVEEAVWLIVASLFEEEVSGALWDTEHVSGRDSEVHTNRVALNKVGIFMSLVLGWCLGGWLWSNLMEILGIVVKVVIVINNNSLHTVDILNDSEWIELNLVGDLVLSRDQNTVLKDLDELVEVLLNLDLVPLDTNTGVRDGKSFFLFSSLDFNLHDSFLEEGAVEIEMGGSEVNVVLLVVLVLVEVEASVNRVLMDGEAVWHDVVSGQKVVGTWVLSEGVSLGELGEALAESGSIASVDLLHGGWGSSLILVWVGVAMIDKSVLVVVIMWMMDWFGVNWLMEVWLSGVGHLSLEKLLHVQFVGSEFVSGSSGLD